MVSIEQILETAEVTKINMGILFEQLLVAREDYSFGYLSIPENDLQHFFDVLTTCNQSISDTSSTLKKLLTPPTSDR